MRIRDPLALHGIDPHRRRVEQNIDNVILQQVDLIHVENIAVRRRQDTRLKLLAPVSDRRLHVERSDHAILGRADGQLHHAHRNVLRCKLPLCTSLLTRIAVEFGGRRITVARTAAHRTQIRQKCGSRSDSGRLRRPLLPLDEHTSERRHHNTEEKRRLHLLLPNDSGKGVCHPFFHSYFLS